MQGRPVYVQAGSSEDGRAFAARRAEAIFTAHQTLASAQSFYADIESQAASLDRNPDPIKVLPGISPFIGSTETEAKRIEEEVNALIHPAFSLAQLPRPIGVDLTGHDLDAPFPRELVRTDSDIGLSSRFQVVLDIVDREKPTLRQLIQRLAGARALGVHRHAGLMEGDTRREFKAFYRQHRHRSRDTAGANAPGRSRRP